MEHPDVALMVITAERDAAKNHRLFERANRSGEASNIPIQKGL